MKGAWTPPSPHLASTCQEGEFCCLRCVQGCRGCCGLAPLQPQTTDQQVASALWTTHLCAETGHTPGPTRLDPVSRPLSCLGRRDGRMAQFTELPQSSGFLCAGSVPHRPAQRHTRLSPHSAPTASSYKRTWLHAPELGFMVRSEVRHATPLGSRLLGTHPRSHWRPGPLQCWLPLPLPQPLQGDPLACVSLPGCCSGHRSAGRGCPSAAPGLVCHQRRQTPGSPRGVLARKWALPCGKVTVLLTWEQLAALGPRTPGSHCHMWLVTTRPQV